MEISLSPTKGFRNGLVIYKNQSTEEKERHGINGAKTFVVKGNIADRNVQFVKVFEGTAEREKTIIAKGLWHGLLPEIHEGPIWQSMLDCN